MPWRCLRERRYSSNSFMTSALDGVSGQPHAWAVLYPWGKDPPVPIAQEAGHAPEPVWTQRLEEKFFSPITQLSSPWSGTILTELPRPFMSASIVFIILLETKIWKL
jgi:hypothetical protein